MVPAAPAGDIKGKVEMLKMWRLPKGYPFLAYYFGVADPCVQRKVTFAE
jgi:hypothetical protein